MEAIFVGDYIRRRRRELQLTQEEVCDGICDPATLSRIENGRQTPSRSRLDALMERLGMPKMRYYAVMSRNELEIEAAKKEIIGCNVLERVDEGLERLARLEALAGEEDVFTRQFILRSRVLLKKLAGQLSPQEEADQLLAALRLTIPEFELERVGEFLYSFNEMKLLNQVAGALSDLGQREKALAVNRQMLDYIETHYQEVLSGNGILPMVMHNYARELNLAKQYQKSVQVAEEGRQICLRYGHSQFLPDFYELMAEGHYFCGREAQSKRCYRMAYYLSRAMENPGTLLSVQNEAKQYFNLTFED